ncbi:MAG: ATP-binding protein [Bacteroidota bacterium]
MIRIQPSSIEKLSLGYRFESDREVVSMIFINYFFILLFCVIVILLHSADEKPPPMAYRYHSLILICMIDLLLIKARRFNLARTVILTMPPIIILILPPLSGVYYNEFYFWFPYVPIILSLIPHYILHTVRHRTVLMVTLVTYFFLALLIDNYLIFLSDGSESIIPIVIENRFYYNLIPIVSYLFVNMALGLLFARNFSYEMIMRKQQNELAQSEKMASLGTLTAGIAHEINNPLNFISGSLHALNTMKSEWIKIEEAPSPEKEKLLRQIDQVMESSFEGVKRANDIISSLNILIAPGQKKKAYELDRIFSIVLQKIELKIPDHITLSKEIQPGLRVFGYKKSLQQVFSNILDNAIEAIESKETRERERIHISLSEEKSGKDPFVRISISNTGPLIREENIKLVFDPFFTSKEVGKGKGLGMTICYMIVREHKGKMEVRNEHGKVVVNVLLPLVTT